MSKKHQAYVIRLIGSDPPMYRCDRHIKGETRMSDCKDFHHDLQLAKTFSTKHALSGRNSFWEMVPVKITL